MKKHLLTLVVLMPIAIASANNSENYKFIELNLGKNDKIGAFEVQSFKSDVTTQFGFGMGTHHFFKESWSLDTEISLMHSTTRIQGKLNDLTPFSGKYKETGVWFGTKLVKNSIFPYTSPFVKTSIGILNSDFQPNQYTNVDKNIPNNDLALGLKIMGGLEFEVQDKFTFSIGVANSAIKDI